MGILIKSYQYGGGVDTTGYANRAAELMRKYKNYNWVQRADSSNASPNPIDHKTHYMGYTTDDNGNYIASPNVIQKSGENSLYELKDRKEYFDYNKKYGINLGNDRNFAEYFTQVGYKAKFPSVDYNEAKINYAKNINNTKGFAAPKSLDTGSYSDQDFPRKIEYIDQEIPTKPVYRDTERPAVVNLKRKGLLFES